MTTDHVPPEAGSAFAPGDGAARDGYYDRDWIIAELGAWCGLAQPAAEQYLDRHGAAQAIERIQSQVRR